MEALKTTKAYHAIDATLPCLSRQCRGSSGTVMEALKTKAYLERRGGKPDYRDNAVVAEGGTVRTSPSRGRVGRSRGDPEGEGDDLRAAGFICLLMEIPGDPEGQDARSTMRFTLRIGDHRHRPCRALLRRDRRRRATLAVQSAAGHHTRYTLTTQRAATRCRAEQPEATTMFATGQRSWTMRPISSIISSSASVVTFATPQMRVRRLTAAPVASTGRCAAPCGSRDASSSKSMPRSSCAAFVATKSAVAPSQPINAASSVSTGRGAVSLPPPEGGVSVLKV